METIKQYNVPVEEYKIYHLVYLYAQKLKSSNPKETNDFWVEQIELEINNYKNNK
jgi:hypothetical protein